MLSPWGTQILAVAVLVALGLVPIVLAVRAMRRLPLRPIQAFWYGVNVLVSRLLWRTWISRQLPIAPGQGAVIVSNHRAPIDPCFIELATDRVVHWMVAKEYWSNRVLGAFFRLCEAIPVSRGGIDTAATKMSIRYASQGELVGMFPEGRINRGDAVLLPGRPGAAMVALNARVPIIPCYIEGSPYHGWILDPFRTPARVRLIVGDPIDLSPYYGREGDREVQKEITLRVLAEIARLAGHPDFQPRLAGRFYKPGLEG